MNKAEIVIIGGGVVGASVAFHLTERGYRDVLILERANVQGTGSTGAATGGVRAQFETDINIRMSLYSLDFLKNWEFDCEYEPKGYLFFATTKDQLEYLKANTERQRELGVRGVSPVDVDAIKEIVPGLHCEDIVGGVFGKQDGFVNPLAIMRGFTEAALRNGAKIEFNCDVTSLISQQGKIIGVETSKGRIDCAGVVVCSGAWAREIAATAGINVPVEPQRRQIVWARTEEPIDPHLPMVIDIGSGFHFRPARDFRGGTFDTEREVLFAYPDPDERSGFDTDFNEGFIDKVYAHARHRAPFLADSIVLREKCRAGLYENTPDHHAILGGCDVDGLYLAVGFSGHGVMHSPATGRALAEIICDGRARFIDVSCLSLDRFNKGELLREAAFI
ncbi:NAD(P)/FAD-dependent oxidoreductase [Leptolyngbya sp. 7M]|uniref:NAD(P)/FAD-dependent oxidoreductase n=1 Tax=Leptolyngbya sp. 7M TaxID=2812896 RepID=UPI001B8BB454|nr:FAD-dependent oxidoreductase [Leptolyngbya sp. 7M]QYO66738.1 FAD-binding oxidoreductase [Leptolyngbya sp. 7M]